MTKKPTIEQIALHVMEYARSKQLRGGWGQISECYTTTELAEFLGPYITSKAAGLAAARVYVKVWNEIHAAGRRELETEARYS